MAAFKREKGKGSPAISTASLPDIVFMLLFFFMTVTTMREVELKVDFNAPQASEISKLENKALLSYIYVGAPIEQLRGKYGEAPRIQLNDAIEDISQVATFIQAEREAMNPASRPKMITALKIDKKAKMGVVTDIKQELRKVRALKINYVSLRERR
ncbi:MAG: biopolymer transporter ExbD [Bacteroidota bacterium]|nr:biopolymer transporter ExbD [Bacteroidota bacterium]